MSLKKYKSHRLAIQVVHQVKCYKVTFPQQRKQGAAGRAGLSLGDGSAVSPCHPLAWLVTAQLHLGVLTVTQGLCWHRDTEGDTTCDTMRHRVWHRVWQQHWRSLLTQSSCPELGLEPSTGGSSWGQVPGRVRGQEGHWELSLPLWSWVMWLIPPVTLGRGLGLCLVPRHLHSHRRWGALGVSCFLTDARPCHAVASVNKGSLGNSYSNSPENNDWLSSYRRSWVTLFDL